MFRETNTGKFLGINLVSLKHPNRLRCGVVVFLCCSLASVAALIGYLVHITKYIPSRMDISLNETWYLRRADWNAMPAYSLTFRPLPVPNVILGHSGWTGNYCEGREDCIEKMHVIQQDHFQRRYSDVGPNFLVGGEGFIFEGRGANILGVMVLNWNTPSITIMFMGDYSIDFPNQLQFDHINRLLEVLVEDGVLMHDYTLYGHCQLRSFIFAPGRNVMAQIDNFSHWNSSNTEGCI